MIYLDVNEKYMYHQQIDEMLQLVIELLQLLVMLFIYRRNSKGPRLLEFCLSDKILIKVGEVLWCHSILVYLAMCHDLQHQRQRLLQSLGIYSLFFMNFDSFNHIQRKSRMASCVDWPFWKSNCFYIYIILCLSMNSISPKNINFSKILLRMGKMEIGW